MNDINNKIINEPSKISNGMNKSTSISIIIVVVVIIGGIIFLSSKSSTENIPNTNIKINDNTSTSTTSTTTTTAGTNPTSNVSIENGVQIITLEAKGGYSPRRSVAQAGLPSVIRFSTNGTFDCSASIRLPSLNVSRLLPQTGTTDIPLGTSSLGIFRGSCGMGMYPFEIDFK